MKEPDMYFIHACNDICSLKLTQTEYNKIKTKVMLGATATHLNGRQVITQGRIALKQIKKMSARYLGKCVWEISPITPAINGTRTARWSSTTNSISLVRRK